MIIIIISNISTVSAIIKLFIVIKQGSKIRTFFDIL